MRACLRALLAGGALRAVYLLRTVLSALSAPEKPVSVTPAHVEHVGGERP